MCADAASSVEEKRHSLVRLQKRSPPPGGGHPDSHQYFERSTSSWHRRAKTSRYPARHAVPGAAKPEAIDAVCSTFPDSPLKFGSAALSILLDGMTCASIDGSQLLVTTPLELKAQGLLRKPSGRLKAQSEPQDVQSSVMIAIEDHTTMHARVRALAEVFVWPFELAGAAQLAGLVGVHKHDGGMPGALSLGTHQSRERCPPSVLYRLVQASFGGSPIGQECSVLILPGLGTPAHVLGFQVFKDHRLVAGDQSARLFM